MTPPDISVLIDTYNYGQFIGQAVESVLAQDFPAHKMEVIVVDDGSTDDTPQRLAKYGDRIRCLRKSNGGQASAFNVAFSHSVGGIVAFLDADDYWLPGKLRRIAEAFEENPAAGMVHHRLVELDMRTGALRKGAFSGLSGNFAAGRKSILSFDPTPTSSLAFRRSVLEKIFPIPESIRFQADGYIQAIASFLAPIVAIDETLGVYRFHGSNLYYLSSANDAKDRERRAQRAAVLRFLVEEQQNWFRSHGYDLAGPVVRASLGRWMSVQRAEEFAVDPPGRLRFFRHLLRTHWNYLPAMNWRHRTVSFANAFGALLTGYEHYHLLDEWRQYWKRKFRRSGQDLAEDRATFSEPQEPPAGIADEPLIRTRL